MILGKHTNGFVRLSARDRALHVHIIGGTGAGKSTLIGNMLAQDLRDGEGVCLIDPHGDLAAEVLALIPPERAHELVYINTGDLARPVAWNPLSNISEDNRPRVADDIVGGLRRVWADSWGPRMEYILLNAVRALLDADETLLGLPRLLSDERYRRTVLRKVCDPVVERFWTEEFGTWDARFRQEAISPIQNKIGRLLSTPAVRNILAQKRSTIDLRKIMDEGGILIVNLSKGKLGEDNAHLLGALLVSSIAQAALSRGEVRRPFHFYVDEFQNFATESFGTILSESRKYGLTLTLAHQFLSQVPLALREAVLGNTGNVICFRVGAEDAPLLARHIGLKKPEILNDLSNYQAWGRFLKAGHPSDPMFLDMFPPAEAVNRRVGRMVQNARIRFGKERKKVEANIRSFLTPRGHDRQRRTWEQEGRKGSR